MKPNKAYILILNLTIILGYFWYKYQTEKIKKVGERQAYFFNPSQQRKFIPPDEEEANNRFLVYECVGWCAGWGNRLHGVFTAYYLAILSNRAFRIQMSEPCHLDNFLTPNRVNWNKKYPRVNKYFRNSIPRMNYTELRDLYETIMGDSVQVVAYQHYSAKSLHFLANQRKFREAFIKLGYTSEELENFNLFSIPFENNIFNTLFTLNTELREEMEKIFSDKKLVCAHIRLAETGEKPKLLHLVARNTTKHVWPHFGNLFNQTEYREHGLFIATDSKRVVQDSITKFKDRIVMAKGSLANIQRWAKNGTRPEKFEACNGLRRVILDWKVLSECDLVIKIPQSTSFSGTAIAMSEHKNALVFDRRKKTFVPEISMDPIVRDIEKHPYISCTFDEDMNTKRCN